MAGTTGRRDHRGEHRDVTSLPESLPPHLLARLAAEGIESIEQWLGLGRQRRMLFGVTARHITVIDAAVEAVIGGTAVPPMVETRS